MRSLQDFRAGKPAFYPDHAVYAAYACAEYGLAFNDLDGGSGLLFRISSKARFQHFGAGRCSWYPQNGATAATLASDKYFANRILEEAGIATLGGQYFFLHERHRAHRPDGRERNDAFDYLGKLNGSAFVKPLTGSRGDFAQAINSGSELDTYLRDVSRYYDAILMQPVVVGAEYRIFLLDGEIVYSARKSPPSLLGDGVRSVRELLAASNASLAARGLSTIDATAIPQSALNLVLAPGERREIPGRANLSVGGKMVLESPRPDQALAMAKTAAHVVGLRVAAVDLFTEIDGQADQVRIIEVNSNPSIRLLEELDRADLILKIWRHTFSATGLLDV